MGVYVNVGNLVGFQLISDVGFTGLAVEAPERQAHQQLLLKRQC